MAKTTIAISEIWYFVGVILIPTNITQKFSIILDPHMPHIIVHAWSETHKEGF